MAIKNFIVYGLSGSGLQTALRAFGEFGYSAVTGVELTNVTGHLELATQAAHKMVIAPRMNPHNANALVALEAGLTALKQHDPELRFLYLSAPTENLVTRYSQASKQHPFLKTTLVEAIEAEQALYQAVKKHADYHVDTSTTTEQELKLKIAKILGLQAEAPPLTIQLISFGFKHGVPLDAELVFDMRFLPNPFYEKSLKPLTGLNQPVQDYVMSFPESRAFEQHWFSMLGVILPAFHKQGKTRVTLAIGCTGGQHRSVTMAERLKQHLGEILPEATCHLLHREQHHWPQSALVL
jgi:RNase adapter protein RapZ